MNVLIFEWIGMNLNEFALEFDECDPEVNTSSVDWRKELWAKCIQSVTNQNVEPDNNCSESEDNEEDAMEIDSKSAVNLGKALAMLDKLQVFFEENDAENQVLLSVTSLTKMVEKLRIQLRNKQNLNKSIGREKSTI